MLNLRDRDVHYGELSAEALPKMIEIDDRGDHWNLHSLHHNAALFGPTPMTEHENPDGTTVRGVYGLQGTVGLYVEIDGCRLEATTACISFIAQLQSLLRATELAEAAKTPSAAAAALAGEQG
jgi:hypothetical protein